MFEKNEMQVMYLRKDFTYCEKLYEKYLEMRQVLNDIEFIIFKIWSIKTLYHHCMIRRTSFKYSFHITNFIFHNLPPLLIKL